MLILILPLLKQCPEDGKVLELSETVDNKKIPSCGSFGLFLVHLWSVRLYPVESGVTLFWFIQNKLHNSEIWFILNHSRLCIQNPTDGCKIWWTQKKMTHQHQKILQILEQRIWKHLEQIKMKIENPYNKTKFQEYFNNSRKYFSRK